LEAEQARLNVKELFWGDGGEFAQTLLDRARSMPTVAERLITTLIPVAGSRMGTAASVLIKAGHIQPAIFWSCIVAETGQMKTPVQQVVINPLRRFESEEYKRWQAEMIAYQKAVARTKKGEESPEEPNPRMRYILMGSSMEARINYHIHNPRGLLVYRDEWRGFFTSRNKYRKGLGDDLDLELEEFNGGPLVRDLVSESTYLERSAISKTGSTQPKTLRELQGAGNFDDHQGLFARWLFCAVPAPLAYLTEDEDEEVSDRFDAMLMNLYLKLGALPERTYRLSKEAFRILQFYQHQLIDWAIADPHEGMKAAYPKLQSYASRLALWLHLVNEVLAGREPGVFIDAHTMSMAVDLTHFYLAQIRLIYAINSTQQELEGSYLKIKQLINKRPGVTIREIKSRVFALRKVPSNEIETMCNKLIELRVLREEDKRYYPYSGSVDHDDQLLISDQQHETHAHQGLEGNIDSVVDFVDDFATNGGTGLNGLGVSQEKEQKCSPTTGADDGDDQLLILDQQHETYANQGFEGDIDSAVDHVDVFAPPGGTPDEC
jgi:hypothetical protein